MDTTSETLLARIKDPTDDEAWRLFFRLYFPMVAKYARMRGLRAGEAEDVAQDCMEILARHMRGFQYSRDRGRFRAFLHKMANNRITNLQRRKPMRQARSGELERLPARTSRPDEAVWNRLWLHQHLKYCLRQVESRHSEQTVRAFRMYALEQWPVERVCQTLGLTANQVYLAKTRMIRRLRRQVARSIGEVL